MIESVYEPIFVLLVGIALYFGGMQNIAGLLVASSALMFLRSRYNYALYKTKILDERDAMIEAEFAMQALNGSPSKETKGFIIKGANSLDPQDKKAMGKRILSNDDFEKNFPDAAKVTMSKDDMRSTT